jgi:hydroxymethylpyrimidine/phosphomethylpyrimidine kinase
VPEQPSPIPRLLSIAGSDSGGGAGIQADLKAFARCGAHGMTAITAITCQNTVGVQGVTPIPAEAIIGQVKAVAEDIGVDAVKVGMLGSVETIEAVATALDLVGDAPIVLDPVMVAESGAPLLEPDAVGALVALIVPRAAVVTPNLHEAAALLGNSGASTEEAARAIHALGPGAIVITGGHGERQDRVGDVFFDGERMDTIEGPRYPLGASHGSGCTHSSVLAAQLAMGRDSLDAARIAQQLASEAVRDGLRELGAGSGPVDVLGLRVIHASWNNHPHEVSAPDAGQGRSGAR